MKYLYLFFIFLLICNVYALRYDELDNVVKTNYLVNPLDSNESVNVTLYSKINCSDPYWVLEANSGKDYIYLNDKTPSESVQNSKARTLLESYLFYSKIKSNYYNSQMVNYFSELGKSL